jgi:hypothetical protein
MAEEQITERDSSSLDRGILDVSARLKIDQGGISVAKISHEPV